TIAGRRHRGSARARTAMLSAWAPSAPAPSASSRADGAATLAAAWASWRAPSTRTAATAPGSSGPPSSCSAEQPGRSDRGSGQAEEGAAQQAMVLRGPQLDTARLGLAVEAAVRGVVVTRRPVGGFPQVDGAGRGLRPVVLLRGEPGAGQVAVEQPGGDRVGREGSGRASADPVLT